MGTARAEGSTQTAKEEGEDVVRKGTLAVDPWTGGRSEFLKRGCRLDSAPLDFARHA